MCQHNNLSSKLARKQCNATKRSTHARKPNVTITTRCSSVVTQAHDPHRHLQSRCPESSPGGGGVESAELVAEILSRRGWCKMRPLKMATKLSEEFARAAGFILIGQCAALLAATLQKTHENMESEEPRSKFSLHSCVSSCKQ